MSSTDRDKSAQAASSPGWKLVDSRWLWWDGNKYTAEWDGTQTIAIGEVEADSKPPKKPGWGFDPHDSIPPWLVGVSAAAGMALTALALAIAPTREGPRSERCRYPSPPVDVSGWSWLVWLGVLAAAAVVVRGGWRSMRPWRLVLAVCGAVAAIMTCPITFLFFEDLDLVNC